MKVIIKTKNGKIKTVSAITCSDKTDASIGSYRIDKKAHAEYAKKIKLNINN